MGDEKRVLETGRVRVAEYVTAAMDIMMGLMSVMSFQSRPCSQAGGCGCSG